MTSKDISIRTPRSIRPQDRKQKHMHSTNPIVEHRRPKKLALSYTDMEIRIKGKAIEEADDYAHLNQEDVHNCGNSFRWSMKSGRRICVCQMKTSHLFYTIRMLWNNLMPDPVPDNPIFYDLSKWKRSYIEDSLKYMMAELVTRELTEKQIAQFAWMKNMLELYGRTHQPNKVHGSFIQKLLGNG